MFLRVKISFFLGSRRDGHKKKIKNPNLSKTNSLFPTM